MPTELQSENWYYARDRKKVGPVNLAHLQALAAAGQLRPADMILCEGASRWTQALAVDGLFPPAPERTEELPAPRLAVAAPAPLAVWMPDAPPHAPLPPTVGLPACGTGQESASGTMSAAGRAAGERGLPAIPGYVLRAELGRGGMGVVYQAEHIKLKRVVALKMVLGGDGAGSQQLDRFRAEAEAVARLQHPNIVQVYEVGERDGLPFFSLEYCAGGSLAQRLDGTPLPSRQAASLIETLARAMHAAHERAIVHRDLKPANILFDAAGNSKVTDFGLAKKLDETAVLTQSGAVMGTPSYMAPEQALGQNKEVGPAADTYALGSILYELLTGRPPFKAANAMETILQVAMDEPVSPSRLQSKVPPDLETICLKCLEKAPGRRYATALALAEDLHRFLAGEPIHARPAGRVERYGKWARRRPTAASLLAVSVLGVLTILIGGLYFTVQLRRERNTALEQMGRARESAAAARRQEEKTKQQEQLTDKERRRAETREADARRELDQSCRSLLTAQLWRVAGLLEHEPMEALARLEDQNACPPDLRDFTWRYYRSLYTEWKPALLQGHRGPVSAVAVSPDGKTLASAEGVLETGSFGGRRSGIIKLWNLESRIEMATLIGHKGDAFNVLFSPDGKLLASAGYDRTVRLWDVEKKQEIATLNKHSGPVSGLAFSPDGNWLVSCSMWFDPNEKDGNRRFKKGEVQLWNVTERKHERLLFSAPATGIQAVSFAPDGKTVAVGTNFGALHLIDVNTGKEISKYGQVGWVYRVAYSPDGQTVAWSTAEQCAFLSDVAGKKTRLTLSGHQRDVGGLAWSPDGKTLATGSTDGVIKLWNPTTGKERLTLRGGAGGINNLAFTPDGNTLIVAQGSPQVVLWDLIPRTSWATYPAHKGFRAVTLSHDGRTLAAAPSMERILKLWDLRSKKERTLKLETGGAALAFAPRNSLLAVGMHGWKAPEGAAWRLSPLPTGECQLWDTNGDRKLATLKTKMERAITALAFTPEGRSLITGDTGGQVYLWDVTNPEKLKEGVLLGSHRGAVSALTLSADGRTLATGGADHLITLWDLAERRERTTLKGHRGPITGLAFVDGGESLASTGHDRSVRIWDVSAGKERFSLPDQPNAIHSLAVSKDGHTLALACHDRTIKLWDLPSRQLRAVLLGHTREVNAVTFSRDGKLLLSASAPFSSWFVTGGEVKIWKADE